MIRPEEVDAFLVDLPAAEVPGVGPKTAAALARFNILKIRDLRALSREELAALFGGAGEALYDRARGRDTRVVAAREVPKTISRETTFHRETTDPAEIRGMLHYLVERAMKAVRELGVVARTVAVRIRYADFKGERGQARLAEPTRLEGPVFRSALALLGRLHARRVALRHVGVALSGLSLEGVDQMSLLEPDGGGRDRLAEALDELRGRFGFSAITAGRSLDLLGRLRRDSGCYVLRTPCLTK
jgi:DNA polymerase-4